MTRSLFTILAVLAALTAAGGCGDRASGDARQAGGPNENGPVAVDVVLAREGALRPELEYTGTTRATREVTLRARTEGRLLRLLADVGDRVERGQAVARLDDVLLRAAVRQAEAELASRQSEVAGARVQVGEARTRVEQARLDLVQKRADAERYENLAREGAAPRQLAEQARTAARTAEQVLRSQTEQVRNLQAAVRAAEARVRAQRAVIAQERERLSYAVLRSPVEGFVTAKLTDAGSLVQPGDEVIRVGDFRVAQVDVQVSELELPRVALGQRVRVQLDALGETTFSGRVDRISPQADPLTRLIPVTITLANPEGRIGGGMLARVRFGQTAPLRIVIPDTALQRPEGRGAEGGPAASGANEARASSPADAGKEAVENVFVLAGEEPQAPAERGGDTRLYGVEARRVRVGARADGQAEVLSGLRANERVIARSARPLKPGDRVRPSILSEEALAAAPAGGR